MGRAAQQFNTRDGNVQILCDHFGHGLVGFPVGRRRGRTHLQEAISYTGNFVVFCAWHDADGEDKVVPLPLGAGCELAGQIGNGLIPAITMVKAMIRMIAKIGEMSRPPIGGMIRRNGARIRSVIVCISAMPGL